MRRHVLIASALVLAAMGCKTANSGQPSAALKADALDSTPAASTNDPGAGLAIDWVPSQSILVDMGNKTAFEEKIRVIDSATKSIRVGYFIFGFDESTSFLVERLLAKAAQGVDVKVIVDGMTSMKNRDWWRMVMAQSALAVPSGGKPILVQYFRPIADEVWADLDSWGFKDPTLLKSAMAGLDASKLQGVLASNTLLKDNPAMKLFLAAMMPSAGAKPDMVGIVRDAAISGQFPAELSFDGLTASLFKGVSTAGFTFRTKAWVNIIKRFHHKLLLVDDKVLMGGGRNVEDHYHVESDYGPKLESDDLLSFMDADFVTESTGIAAAAAKSFDDYWYCGDAVTKCAAKIAMEREKPADGEKYDELRAKLRTMAKHYETESKNYVLDPERVLHHGRIKADGVKLAYLENRMHPVRKNTEKLAFGEETSKYNEIWDALIENAKTGDDIVIHNAYVLLTPTQQLAVVKAMQNGAKLRIFTNSDVSSNHKVVNVFAGAQYAAMLAIAHKIKAEKNLPEVPLNIYLYQTSETLHTKVGLIGDYMIVGSTNADPRSKILDTQNGVLIGPGASGNPLAKQYRDWLASQIGRQRKGKQVLLELTLEAAMEAFPPYEKVKASPDDYRKDQQFDSFAAKLFTTAMDPASSRVDAVAASGLLNTLFLNL